jgi:hypothetical protein
MHIDAHMYDSLDITCACSSMQVSHELLCVQERQGNGRDRRIPEHACDRPVLKLACRLAPAQAYTFALGLVSECMYVCMYLCIYIYTYIEG